MRMLWIGGTQGAGKSTLAQDLALTHDLPVHHIDAYTFAHAARLATRPSLDEQLAQGPAAAADAWDEVSRERLALILADLRARDLGDVPTIVEGPQLTPALADGLPVEAAVWLLVDPEVTREVRQRRAESAGDEAARRRVGALGAREAEVRRRLEAQLAAGSWPALQVLREPDWATVRQQVAETLGLESPHPRLAGAGLTRARRQENQAVASQVEAYHRSLGRAGDGPELEFACECGRSGCGRIWRGTARAYREAGLHEALR